MKQVHGVDDEGYVGRILSGRIGELLLGDDGVLRQNVGPALGPDVGEVAIDAANARLPDLGNLLEQSVRDLCRSIVGIDQHRETGRTGFGRHGFPQSLNRRTSSCETAPWMAADGYTDVGARAARPNFPWREWPTANPAQAGFASGITPPSATVNSAATSRTACPSIGNRSSVRRLVM